MSDRPSRELDIDGRAWRLVDAWRSTGGMGLGYFVCLDPEEGPGSTDRRAVLPKGTGLGDLGESDIVELWKGAAPLTGSERRFEDDGGDLWLAQATGPAWSEGGATDAIGLRLVCLTRDAGPVEVGRRRLSDLEDDDLSGLVARPAS